MANWKSHALLGIVYSTIFYFLARETMILSLDDMKFLLYVPFVFIASLLPDIDSVHSVIRRMFYGFMSIATITTALMFLYTEHLVFAFACAVSIIYGLIVSLSVHHGSMHSFTGGILLLSPLLLIDIKLFLACCAAYFSHLLLDGNLKLL